jgi:hypothetical protein
MTKFRQYISNVFADQLQGTVNDVRGDKSTARPKVLESLPALPSVLQKPEGDASGPDLTASKGTAWGAHQAVTEYISHKSGRAKDPIDAARKRLESAFWGPASNMLTKAHEFAMTMQCQQHGELPLPITRKTKAAYYIQELITKNVKLRHRL